MIRFTVTRSSGLTATMISPRRPFYLDAPLLERNGESYPFDTRRPTFLRGGIFPGEIFRLDRTRRLV